MRKFFLKCLLFVLIPLLIMITGVFLPPYPGIENSYLFAKRDKDTLLKRTPSPRIILMGGSNLALSLNSKLILDSLGINPVDTGLDCNTGLFNMMQNILRYIRQGDVVVLSVEYEQFFGNLMEGEYASPVIYYEVSPDELYTLNFRQWVILLRNTPGYALRRLKIWKYFEKQPVSIDGNYQRSSFNSFGDHFTHRFMKSHNPSPTLNIGDQFNSRAITALVEFSEKLQNMDAKLLVSFPPYQQSSYQCNADKIKKVETTLRKTGFQIISTPEEYCMPDSVMFDSPYHLRGGAIEERTRLLIGYLKASGIKNVRQSIHF